jgi:hypothetical protein
VLTRLASHSSGRAFPRRGRSLNVHVFDCALTHFPKRTLVLPFPHDLIHIHIHIYTHTHTLSLSLSLSCSLNSLLNSLSLSLGLPCTTLVCSSVEGGASSIWQVAQVCMLPRQLREPILATCVACEAVWQRLSSSLVLRSREVRIKVNVGCGSLLESS